MKQIAMISCFLLTSAAVAQTINPDGITNAASYSAAVAPGSIAAVFGNFVYWSPTAVPLSPMAASGLPLPLVLENLSIGLIFNPTHGNNVDAPLCCGSFAYATSLFFVSSRQVNLQVPWLTDIPRFIYQWGLGGGSWDEQLAPWSTGEWVSSNWSGVPVRIVPFAPGIFTTNAQGNGQGAILDSSYRLVDQSNPAIPGRTTIQIYCTGLGQVTNTPHTGYPALAVPLSYTTYSVNVEIGGVEAPVFFSGLAPGYVGLYQVNALVPGVISGGSAVPVTVSIHYNSQDAGNPDGSGIGPSQVAISNIVTMAVE
jgi:uncharacterized protein (TIGR03437 family)